MVILLASAGATASPIDSFFKATVNPGILLSQAEAPPDVIIDTDPQGSGSSTSIPSTTNGDQRFSCQMVDGEYTVVYYPQSQPGQAYPWAVPRQLGGGWTSAKRCDAISQRLESYRPDGLVELTTSVENNYETICVTTEADPSCRIVLTVPPGQDALVTRDRVFQNLTTADSGQMTQGVNTFRGDNGEQLIEQIGRAINLNTAQGGINLKPFLDEADGGTGTQLRGAQPRPSDGQPLNPDNFR
ncbi:MAG: COP23 domain-containing protein [Cyanophyceae cyanobacterium]